MKYILSHLKLQSKIFLILLYIISISLLPISYFLITSVNRYNLNVSQNITINNYKNNLQNQIEFYASQINYGKEYMKRYTVYNSTVDDFIALSSQNDKYVNFFINDIRIVYNISYNEIDIFTKRMNLIVPNPFKTNNLTIIDIINNNNNTITIEKAGNRSWYCPLLFVSPIALSSYIPGLDLCYLKTFIIINDILENNNLNIQPRTTIISSSNVLLDLGQKTSNGFVVLTLNMTNIINNLIENNYNVKLEKDNNIFYNDCGNSCNDTNNWKFSNLILPNNETMNFYIYFGNNNLDISTFLYVLFSIIIINIVFTIIVIKYEIETNRYLLANKMLGYVNHEIRNPLNCINGLIEISLIELQENKEYTELYSNLYSNLNTANRACDMLSHIVNDILDVKKIADGKLIIKKSNIIINDFLIHLCKIINVKLSEKPHIKFSINSNDINTIYTDEHRLLQILLNFITNAFKFTENGSIELVIENVDNNIKFSVIDTGIGIDTKYYKHIFQPYEQTDVINSLRHGGFGLGLYLCKELITQLNGKIGFESTLGKGSIFWIELNCNEN